MIDLATKEKAKVQTALKDEISRIKDKAATSSNKYMTALFIALREEEVQQRWTDKVAHNYVPHFVQWEETLIPEQVIVVFPFDCAPGTYCFVNPSFAVAVDWLNERVVSILDPYLPGVHSKQLPSDMSELIGKIQQIAGDGHFPWPGAGGFRKQVKG